MQPIMNKLIRPNCSGVGFQKHDWRSTLEPLESVLRELIHCDMIGVFGVARKLNELEVSTDGIRCELSPTSV